jgi:hypothetical protein
VKAKATHGGSRHGAGRKRLLIPKQVVWIGAGCDNLSRRYAERAATRNACAAARKRGQASQPGMGDPVAHLRLKQGELQAIHPKKRRGLYKDPRIRELRDEAQDWIKAMAKPVGFKGHFGALLLRPKSLRERIKRKMALIASARYGFKIEWSMSAGRNIADASAKLDFCPQF